MRLADSLFAISDRDLHRVAWLERDANGNIERNWDWHNVQRCTAAASQRLLDLGVGSGDRVANLARNSFAWAIADLACSSLNAIHAPLDPRMSGSQQRACLERLQPTLVLIEPLDENAAAVAWNLLPIQALLIHADGLDASSIRHCLRSYDPDSPANILFTSGTMGMQRGVMLSHRNLISNAQAKLDAMPQASSDHRLNLLPFSHAYARTCELTTWLLSRSSMETVPSLKHWFNWVEQAAPSLINGVPIVFEQIHERWRRDEFTKESLHSMLGRRARRLASGGAAISHTIRKDFADAGLPIFQGYGLTEASPVVCSNRAVRPSQDRDCLLEVGPPVNGIELRIDPSSRLWVRGTGVMLGYWQDEPSTQERIVDGWLDTGDLAQWCKDSNTNQQCIRILGRADDTIVLSTGYKIHPFEIEQSLAHASRIDQCLLVGANRPFPILLLRSSDSLATSSVTEDEWLAEIQSHLSHHPRNHWPRHVLVVHDIWSTVPELTNFKGGLRRAAIESYYRERIDQAYQHLQNSQPPLRQSNHAH